MIKKTLLALALIGMLAVPMQSQVEAQVSGTYTVGGSSGSWFLDFTFTNGLAAGHTLYRFRPFGENFNVIGAPAGWGSTGCGSSAWWGVTTCTVPGAEGSGFDSGVTLGGFTGSVTSVAAPTSLSVEVWSITRVNGLAQTSLNDFTATRVSVPEPGSVMLVASGLLGLVGVRRRRQDLGEDI